MRRPRIRGRWPMRSAPGRASPTRSRSSASRRSSPRPPDRAGGRPRRAGSPTGRATRSPCRASPRSVARARTLGLRPAGRRRRAGEVDQVLHVSNARDLPRDGPDALDVLLSVDDPAQEYQAVLCVDADLALGHARAAIELTLHLVGERDLVQWLALTAAGGVDRTSGDPDRVRLHPPSAQRGAPFAPPHPRHRPIPRGVAPATARRAIEDVLE